MKAESPTTLLPAASQAHLDSFIGKTAPSETYAHYARCSKGEQKNIDSQYAKLTQAYGEPTFKYADKGSGLNENRKNLWRLLRDAQEDKYTTLAITAKDRLTRFGYKYLEELLRQNGVAIVVLDDEREKTLQEELMQDFMSLLASFSGKLYKMRGIEQRKLLLKRAEENLDE